MTERTLAVWANPYSAYDHKGRLSGPVLCDPVEHIAYADPDANHPTNPRWEPRRWVGARLDTEATKILSRYAGLPKELRDSPINNGQLQDTVWTFSEDAETIPDTHYYRDRIREGELWPADEATAKECGKDFKSRAELVVLARAALKADWVAHYPEADLPDWATEALPEPVSIAPDEPRLALVKSKKAVA